LLEEREADMRVMSRRFVVGVLVYVIAVGAMAGGVVIARQRAATGVATAARNLLAALTPEQRQKASFALTSEEWTRWHFVPVTQFPRNGLSIKEMTEPQRQRAHDLLKASLSQAGYNTATATMANEETLGAMEAAARGGRGGGIPRDPENYFVSVFGDPSSKAGWGWRWEGHHLSLHFSVDNGKVSMTSTPLFIGANPAEVREGPKTGTRILGAQEDTARALLGALDETQRATAVLAPAAPGDIATMTSAKVDPLTPAGLPASSMTAAQRDMLMKVVDVYLSVAQPEVAADRMAKMKAAGLEKIAFAWAGPLEKGQRYHYRIQGPTFLLEHNNTQNNGNHMHSVWRDFNGDFGRDLLAEHMATVLH
jgi:hypothetical protein